MSAADLERELAYDEDRTQRLEWTRRRSGLSRRELLAAGGAAAGLAGLPGAARAQTPPSPGVVKPTPDELFITRGTNREMRWEALRNRGHLVGNDLFFVRNHTATPLIDATTWRLRIEGTGVREPLELGYDELVRLDAVSVTRAIECAGNGRGFFASQQGTPAPGTQWGLGAIGVAEWTGVPLAHVLERARLKRSARDVMPEGLDAEVPGQGRVRRPLAIDKALAPDTLLAYAMNGQPLPPDHGYPVRLLVPGWVGIASVKWVGRIEVSDQPLASPWNTTQYRLFGDAYPDAPVLTTYGVKSAFELPFPATLPAGRQTLRGRSWSGAGRIRRVEVSTDGGVRWRRAKLLPSDGGQRAWVRWQLPWEATPGVHQLQARALDVRGDRQPATVPFNTLGYQFTAVVGHPVTVA